MESAGARLKKIRQELGLSLEEAQKKTRIHLNILKAIEGDAISDLNPVYLRGFLKIYCKFLSVDPKDYVPDNKEARAQAENAIPAKTLSGEAKKYTAFFKSATLKLNSFRPSKKIKKTLTYALVVLIAVFGLFNLGKAVSSKYKRHLAREKAPRVIPEKKEVKKKQARQAQKAATPPASPNLASLSVKPKKSEAFSGIRLVITAHDNCWIILKVDGKTVFRRILEKGRSENWQAKDKVELSLGNAAAVELEVNGQLFSNLGRRGQSIKSILITKEGLKVGR